MGIVGTEQPPHAADGLAGSDWRWVSESEALIGGRARSLAGSAAGDDNVALDASMGSIMAVRPTTR